MREEQSPTGRLHIIVTNPRSSEIVVERWVDNLITTLGRELLAQLLVSEIPGIAKVWLAVGGYEPVTPAPEIPAASPADLQLRRPLDRFITTAVQGGTVDTSDPPRAVRTISATMPAKLPGDGKTLVLREAGLIMVKAGADEGEVDPETGLAPDEVLYNRVVFAPITKDPQLQMTLTWEVMF